MTQEEFEARIPRYCFCLSITDSDTKKDEEVAYNTNSLDMIEFECERLIAKFKGGIQ